MNVINYQKNPRNITYIYALIRKTNCDVFYVGKSNNPSRRHRQHKEEARNGKRTSRLYSYIKYLWKRCDDFNVQIIESVSIDEWEDAEREYIRLYKLLGFELRNMTEGGQNPRQLRHSIDKSAKSRKGRKLTEEHKKKLSLAKQGYVPWNKGIKTGKPTIHSEETRKKISDKLKGRKMSEEWRANISKARKGQAPKNKGVLNSQGKPVNMYDKNDVFIKSFPTLSEAMRHLGINTVSSICECCKGKRKTAHGYKFSYAG